MGFSETEIQTLLSLGEDACAKTYADNTGDKNRDGNPWKKVLERPDLKHEVYSSQLKDIKLTLWKGVTIFEDMTPEAVNSFMRGNLEQRFTWDRSIVNHEMVPVAGEAVGDRTYILTMVSKSVGPISSREFNTVIMEKRNENGSITAGGVSLLPEHPGYRKENPKIVRAYLFPTGSVYERCGPNGKDCRETTTRHVDLKGWFTTRVSSAVYNLSIYFSCRTSPKHTQTHTHKHTHAHTHTHTQAHTLTHTKKMFR